jgi:hypothetical protein
VDYTAVPLEIVELKAGTDGWQFSAYASTFGNTDHVGDVILAGAFDRTLTTREHRPLLWQHDMREPIGIEKSLKSDSHGLLGTWELIDTQRGSDAYKLLKRGAVRSMSIGYIPEVVEFRENSDARHIKQIELLENSLVSIPANDQALVQSVKTTVLNTSVSFESLMAQIKGHLGYGLDEAEALYARRAAEGRKPSEAHIGAVVALQDELKGCLARLEAMTIAPADAEVKAPDDVLLRLELARLRLRHAGLKV